MWDTPTHAMPKVRKRVGVNPEHAEYLEQKSDFNFSAFVRSKLDEKMNGEA